MHPLPYTWPYGLPFWLIYVWAFAPEMRISRRATRSAAARGPDDAGSLRVILGVTGVALIAAFLIAGWIPAARIPAAWPLYVAGCLLLVAGALLRRHCFRVLGTFFTGAVQVQPEQLVVDRGAYRWVRHPSYSAALLEFTGIGLALANWLSLAVLLVPSFAAYVYRITVEERALERGLGSAYAAYRARTRYRLVPYLY